MQYRYRKPIPELEELMPAWRRDDSKRWAKWKFYPGAVTIMLPRLFFGIVMAIVLCLVLKIMLIGQPLKDPIRGCRRVTIRLFFKLFAWLFQLVVDFNFVTWKTLTMEDVNYYEEWLGPKESQDKEQLASSEAFDETNVGGYTAPIINHDSGNNANGATSLLINDDKNSTDASETHHTRPETPRRRVTKRGRGPPSTVVCNHLGWIDVIALIQSPLHPGFTPKEDLGSVPLLGDCCRAL